MSKKFSDDDDDRKPGEMLPLPEIQFVQFRSEPKLGADMNGVEAVVDGGNQGKASIMLDLRNRLVIIEGYGKGTSFVPLENVAFYMLKT